MKKVLFSLNPLQSVPGNPGRCSLQESVARCTRCNGCVQSCPSYFIHKEETFSPRGRNQILRLLLERKIKPAQHIDLLERTAVHCMLCGRCTRACAGHLAVAEHTLALRQALDVNILPATLRGVLRWRSRRPDLLAKLAGTYYFLRRIGAARLARLVLPLRWVKHLDDILPDHPMTLPAALRHAGIQANTAHPGALYLPGPETAYVCGQNGVAALRLLQKKNPRLLWGFSSGLAEQVYGDKIPLLKTARRLLLEWEKWAQGHKLPLVTESIEMYSFLKNYPVLFASMPGWCTRAEALAAQVRFITDFMPLHAPSHTPPSKTAWDRSGLLSPQDGPLPRVQKILKTHFGKNLVECEYSRFPLPAGGTGFVRGCPAREMVLENVKDMTRGNIEQVFCLSGLAALELGAQLRKQKLPVRARSVVCIPLEK